MISVLLQEDYYVNDAELQRLYDYFLHTGPTVNVTLIPKKHVLQRRIKFREDEVIIGDLDVMSFVAKQLHYNIDTYPSSLKPYYYRSISSATLKEVEPMVCQHPFFVKPKKIKKFTGKVIRDYHDIYGLGGRNTPVYISSVVKWLSEFRVFVNEGSVMDVCPYEKGPEVLNSENFHRSDTGLQLDMSVVEECVRLMTAAGFRTYTLDMGVILKENGTQVTAVVEVNPPYSVGGYNLDPAKYFKFLMAGWREIFTWSGTNSSDSIINNNNNSSNNKVMQQQEAKR